MLRVRYEILLILTLGHIREDVTEGEARKKGDKDREGKGREGEKRGEHFGEQVTLTRELQIRRGCDKDLGATDVDAPPVGVFLVDDEKLVALGESRLLGGGSSIVVESLSFGGCAASNINIGGGNIGSENEVSQEYMEGSDSVVGLVYLRLSMGST